MHETGEGEGNSKGIRAKDRARERESQMFNLRVSPAADRCVRLEKDREVDRDKQRWTKRQTDTCTDMQTDR